MSFDRWWTETTAALGDRLPLPLAALLLVLATALAATAWYTYPAWVPRRLPRPRRRRAPRPRRRPTAGPPPPPATAAPESATPQVDAARSAERLADRLAADGRYAEAIRERLRSLVHDLARRGVRVRPGMTVTEIVSTATARRPAAGPFLAAAAAIFAQAWYAQRPATAEQDHRMREHTTRLRHLLDGETDGTPVPPGGPDTDAAPASTLGNRPEEPAR
ncbi:DUF4129 domain-containing protein [Micromonospora radicis]|uniref:DUF4129 domain-containing protein n=1 Tax=Micromonospora radicis TaxID=1894971 RepID=A0A418MPT0_9ACTN|nr:DUF4129 domain-containing protein [Micromonospora radicis]RIV34610.1 DUF4129 domain-containing protein [Micromonospora radicis]